MISKLNTTLHHCWGCWAVSDIRGIAPRRMWSWRWQAFAKGSSGSNCGREAWASPKTLSWVRCVRCLRRCNVGTSAANILSNSELATCLFRPAQTTSVLLPGIPSYTLSIHSLAHMSHCFQGSVAVLCRLDAACFPLPVVSALRRAACSIATEASVYRVRMSPDYRIS